jgi:hypothetical protein
MNTLRALNRIIAAALLSGGVTVAGIALAAGTAGAYPPGCTQPSCWCPGQPLPGRAIGAWDTTACHDWHNPRQDDPSLPFGVVAQGPMDCYYGPGWPPKPQCKV